MTEKQKRDNGELYYAGKDSDFLDEVIKAKDLCYEYNQIRPTDFKAQHEILEKLLGKIGVLFTRSPNARGERRSLTTDA